MVRYKLKHGFHLCNCYRWDPEDLFDSNEIKHGNLTSTQKTEFTLIKKKGNLLLLNYKSGGQEMQLPFYERYFERINDIRNFKKELLNSQNLVKGD